MSSGLFFVLLKRARDNDIVDMISVIHDREPPCGFILRLVIDLAKEGLRDAVMAMIDDQSIHHRCHLDINIIAYYAAKYGQYGIVEDMLGRGADNYHQLIDEADRYNDPYLVRMIEAYMRS